MRPFSWHRLRLHLPDDWEMTLYGKDPGNGTLEFSTLDGPQARISWSPDRKSPVSPDWIQRDGSFYRKNGSDGLIWSWSFAEEDEDLRRDILGETRFAEENAYTLGLIRARLPSGFTLKDLTVYPANLMLSAEASDRSRLVYRCWGLPMHVLQGKSLEVFFSELLKAGGLRADSLRTCCIRGEGGVEADTSAPGLSPAQRLRGQRARGKGWMWLDRSALRLHSFEQLGPAGSILPEMRDCYEED